MRFLLPCTTLLFAHAIPTLAGAQPVTIRIATFNVEDIRTQDLADASSSRLGRIARTIAAIRPNIILLNEMAYDMPGGPGWEEGTKPGSNARRFVDQYLATLPDMPKYRAWMPPTNTGMPSGFDLDNDGKAADSPGPIDPAAPAASPTAMQRSYANDCYGYGTFPGQYGFALLIDERLELDEAAIRTFMRFPWSYMQGGYMPTDAAGKAWFSPEESKFVRLSSKTFIDAPVKLPNGAVIHLLCSHPTPPAFDGPEQRNKKRNHDEIRLIGEYIGDAPFLVDDNEREGGLGRFDSFVILGDLNADPKKGNSFRDPIIRHLASNPRVNFEFVPTSTLAVPGLEPADTASFKLRVDYVLPSKDLKVLKGEVWRHAPEGGATFPSDHFPVYLDLSVPPPPAPAVDERKNP
ncbi:MAG: endonuclease/exonuclease/phosphatase family protein [Planctomycetota bacterium]|nr:endonuclease/exonuclease/phosphatase family protein [Planctomycetota bacterium]